MNIVKSTNNGSLLMKVSGKIDTITSVQLTDEINKSFEENFSTLIIDFTDVDYISSAGLRTIIMAHKKAASLERKVELINLKQNIKDLFEMTGFSKIFNIA